jgi:hypothetical protein
MLSFHRPALSARRVNQKILDAAMIPTFHTFLHASESIDLR